MALPFLAPPAPSLGLSERFAGRLLGRLGPEGHVVLPDGVVIGPTGVAVVTTLTCTDALRIHHGELWHGRFPHRVELAQVRRRVEQVRRATSLSHPGLRIRPLACVVGADVPADPYCALDVELCGAEELPDRVASGARVLEFDGVLALARHLQGSRHHLRPVLAAVGSVTHRRH